MWFSVIQQMIDKLPVVIFSLRSSLHTPRPSIQTWYPSKCLTRIPMWQNLTKARLLFSTVFVSMLTRGSARISKLVSEIQQRWNLFVQHHQSNNNFSFAFSLCSSVISLPAGVVHVLPWGLRVGLRVRAVQAAASVQPAERKRHLQLMFMKWLLHRFDLTHHQTF